MADSGAAPKTPDGSRAGAPATSTRDDERDFERRTQFFVDRGFQSRYVVTWLSIAFWVAFAVALVYIGGAWLYLRTHEDPALWSEGDYQRALRIFIAVNIIFVLVLVLLVGIAAVLHSHRIAGAAYRIRADLKRFRQGDHTISIRLRRKDYFQELAEEVNETLRYAKTRMRDQERQLELAKDLADALHETPVPERLAEMVRGVSQKIRVKDDLPMDPIPPEKEEEDLQDDRDDRKGPEEKR